MTDIDVSELAQLARLELPTATGAQMAAQVAGLLAHFSILKNVNTEGVEPCAYPLPIPHRPRADEPQEPLPVREVLANAPVQRGDCFVVPRVVES